NVGPTTVEALKRKLGTDPHEGTYYKAIQHAAKSFGLKADVLKPMSLKQLKTILDKGIPVICSIQAYGNRGADYAKAGNGHYVVAIGYDSKDRFYFMDSNANHEGARANPQYGYMSREQFLKRWHEDEGMKGQHEPYQRLGIAIYPDPKKASPLLMAREIE